MKGRSELEPSQADSLRVHYLARAFADTAGAHKQMIHGNPVERFDLPADLADQLVELERATALQRRIAERIGARLVQLVPLDDYFEFDCLLRELAAAHSRCIDVAKLADIERRKERIRDGTIAGNHVDHFHRLREELSVLVASSR